MHSIQSTKEKQLSAFLRGLSHTKENDKGMAGLSVGGRLGDALGVGGGFSFIKYDGAYIPLTVDVSLLPQGKNVTAFAGIKAGYGIYNRQITRSVTIQGGFAGSVFAGVAFPTAKIKTTFLIGGSRYTLTTKVVGAQSSSCDDRIFFVMGVLL